jgi:hypothetical protein
MPLMDYFNSGGDPMAAIMKQIQGAMESFGSRGGTPPQPTQMGPVNPQNAWSLFSGSTNPYTSTGPSKEYQQQRAIEKETSRFGQGMYEASAGEATAALSDLERQRTTPRNIRYDPESPTKASAMLRQRTPYQGKYNNPDEDLVTRAKVPFDDTHKTSPEF